MAEQKSFHIYNVGLDEDVDYSKLKPSGWLEDTDECPHNVWVMCDTTFAQNDYDLGLTNKTYQDMGQPMIPYHYIVSSVEKTAHDIKVEGTLRSSQKWLVGTVFRGRDDRYINGVNEGGTTHYEDGNRLMCSAQDLCICLMLPHGSWLTRGVNTEVAESLKLLILYLCSMYGLDVGKRVFNWKYDGEPDPSINEESWAEFRDELIEAQSSDFNTFSYIEDDQTSGYIVPENMYPSLENVAKKMCSQNASQKEIDDMIEFLVKNNPSIAGEYIGEELDIKKMRNYPIPGGSHIVIPANSSEAAIIKANLTSKNIISDYKKNQVIANEVTVVGDAHNEKYKNQWEDPACVHRKGDDQTFLTSRGGKSEMKWRYTQMELPGYHNGMLAFQKRNSSEDPIYINFLISPSSFSSNYSNNINDTKTLGGWVGVRAGKNPISVRFSGYMLDIYNQLERHRFLADYKNYIEDKKDTSHSYYNEYNCKLIIEGRDYYGYVAGIGFSKEAEKPFIYQYSISFVAYNDKEIYDPSWALVPAYKTERNKGGATNGHGDKINDTDSIQVRLKELLDAGLAGDESTSARKTIEQLLQAAELTDEYTPLCEYWVRVLEHIRDSQDFANTFLKKLRDANIISNLDIWGFEDAEPDLQSVVALLDKLCSYDASDRKPVDSGKPKNTSNGCWSQPNALSLYAKGIIKDTSSWFKSDWSMFDGYQKECTSRAMLLALCDNIGGSSDTCLYKNYSNSDVRGKLKTYAQGYDEFPETIHWCEKDIISLVDKGVLATPVDAYWFEDPEATVSANYAMALICKAFDKTSWAQPVSMTITDYNKTADSMTKASAVKLIATTTNRIGLYDVREDDTYCKRDSSIRWDQPFLCDLYQKAIINDWPVKESGDKYGVESDAWATYENGKAAPSYTNKDLITRGTVVEMCANILGYYKNKSGFQTSAMEYAQIFDKYRADDPSATKCLSAKDDSWYALSYLCNQGVFKNKNLSSYWYENPQGEVETRYLNGFLNIICEFFTNNKDKY